MSFGTASFYCLLGGAGTLMLYGLVCAGRSRDFSPWRAAQCFAAPQAFAPLMSLWTQITTNPETAPGPIMIDLALYRLPIALGILGYAGLGIWGFFAHMKQAGQRAPSKLTFK